jgi:LysM repeat protein
MFAEIEPDIEKDFSDYELGLMSLQFGDTVEVVESYLQDYELTSLDTAIEEVTKDQEKEQIYEVVSGDTLSQIAEKNEIPLADLIAMNETIENENSMIRAGDELIVTVPEPELSVERVEEVYYEEDYEAEIVYVDNDNWYTTEMKTLQEPSAGHRIVVANVSYRNNEETARETIAVEHPLPHHGNRCRSYNHRQEEDGTESRSSLNLCVQHNRNHQCQENTKGHG